jgi:hypothetical protein
LNHKDLSALRDANTLHRPWKPGFALLPSGALVDAKVLREITCEQLFNEMFGVTGESLDSFTQTLIRNGYADSAELTTTFIMKLIPTRKTK